MIHQNILDAIGHTPIVQRKRMVPEGAARVLVKYEGLNVVDSIYYFVALRGFALENKNAFLAMEQN